VRFGIELGGVRWPRRYQGNDPGSGSRERVVRSGERVPDPKHRFEVLIPSLGRLGVAGQKDAERRYWCRYENLVGQTWETRNPADRSADLSIHRVRFLRLREWREQRARQKAEVRGAAKEREVVRDLRRRDA
jgi:hypothetical protein